MGEAGVAIFIENIYGKSAFNEVRVLHHFFRRVDDAARHASFLQSHKKFVCRQALPKEFDDVSASLKDLSGERVGV